MNVAPEITAFLTGLDRLWLPAVDALIKVTLVLGLAGIATVVLGRSSAAVRHLVWTLALSSALMLPVLSIALPRWQLPIVKLQSSVSPTQAPPAPLHPPSPEASARQAAPGTLRAHAPEAQSESHALPSTAPTAEIAATPRVSFSTFSLTMALVVIWMAGVLAVLGRLVVGLVTVAWMSRRTVRVVDAPWLPLAVELASELGITRRLTFLESPRASMPMASGIFKPSVLMPEDANRWPLERLRIVLLHELAHVKRRDCLTHVIAQLACALYWFNPLAWIAARHVRTERERACDDLVLACGTRGPDYAEELLEIARVMRGGRYPALLAGATLAMAHRSQLEGRLIAILDPKVPRAAVSPAPTALTAVGVACALAPLAAMQPWTVGAPEHDPSLVPLMKDAVRCLFSCSGSPVAGRRCTEAGTATCARDPDRGMPRRSRPKSRQTVSDSVTREATARRSGSRPGCDSGRRAGSVARGGPGRVAGGRTGRRPGSRSGSPPRRNGEPRSAAWRRRTGRRTSRRAGQGAGGEAPGRRSPHGRGADRRAEGLRQGGPRNRDACPRAAARSVDLRTARAGAQGPSPDVREQAAHGLGSFATSVPWNRSSAPSRMRTPACARAWCTRSASFAIRAPSTRLIAALKDEHPSVREQAAFALGQIRDPRGRPLIAALKDANGDVREQAVRAQPDARQAGRAGPASRSRTRRDVREQAVFALGQLRDRCRPSKA